MDKRINLLFNKYASFITNNSETTGDVENLCKYLSYFVTGKASDSNIITEGMFTLSHLIVLFNDQIIKNHIIKDIPKDPTNEAEEKIKLFLTILDSVEVFIEVTSQRVLGNVRKFIVISIIQAIKCIGRLLLVIKFKNRISQSPAIEHLDRRNLSNLRRPNAPVTNEPEIKEPMISLKLKRSGKVIRRVSQAPPIYSRSFKALDLLSTDRFGEYNHQAIKSAEIVYILKPMIHLTAVGAFGYKSWKSYILSFFLDVFSIRQYYNYRQYLTSDQKKELSRRCVQMLLYIFRSPFYDQYSANKLDAFMKAVSAMIPFTKWIVEPYRVYIPHYQQSYFYMWSN